MFSILKWVLSKFTWLRDAVFGQDFREHPDFQSLLQNAIMDRKGVGLQSLADWMEEHGMDAHEHTREIGRHWSKHGHPADGQDIPQRAIKMAMEYRHNLSQYRQVAVGADHCYGLTHHGDVFHFGSDRAGQSAGIPYDERFAQIVAFEFDGYGLAQDGTAIYFGSIASDDGEVVVVSHQEKFVYITGGLNHCYGLTYDGRVLHFGFYAEGQSHGIPTDERFVHVCADYDGGYAVTADGRTIEIGNND